MTPGTHVRITPITLWAKNKVRQHGPIMIVRKVIPDGVLLESIDKTYKGASGMETWLGWFAPEEAKLETIRWCGCGDELKPNEIEMCGRCEP